MNLTNFIKKIIRLLLYSLKGNFSYAFSQFRFSNAIYFFILHLINKKKKGTNIKVAIFELTNGNIGRYAFNLMSTFQLANYDIYLKPKYKFYSTCGGLYIEQIFLFLKIKIYYSLHQIKKYNYNIHITDNENTRHSLPSRYDKTVLIDYKNAFNKESNDLLLPFQFHPLVFIHNNLTALKTLNTYIGKKQATEKRIEIIFGGQISHPDYKNINKYFPSLLNRNIIFETLFENFNDIISTSKHDILRHDAKPILIIDSSKKDHIKHKEWLNYLSLSHFFIAPPGFEMPFSHNIIEAMACGVIPILQYNEYFNPKLKHAENCLVFSNIEELINSIQLALNMDIFKIDEMKRNVINYYSNNVDPKSFLNKAETINNKEITIRISAGRMSLSSNNSKTLP